MLNRIAKTALMTFAAIALVGGLGVQAQAMTTNLKGNSVAKAPQSFNGGRSVNTRRTSVNTRRSLDNSGSENRRGFNNAKSINRRGVSSSKSRSGFNRSNIGFSNGYYTRSRSSKKGLGQSRFRSSDFGYLGFYGSGY